MRPLDPVTIDRVVAVLVVAALVSVYVLPSQSAASFPTYLLPIAVVARFTIAPVPIGRAAPVAIAVLLLLVYFSTSVWWSSEFSWRGAFSTYSRCVLIAGFCAGVASSFAASAATSAWLSRAVTVGAALAAVATLVDFHLHPTWDGRLAGLGQLRNSVVAALTFSAALLIALDAALNDTKWWRIAAVLAIAAIGGVIVATGSRNGYASAAVGSWIALLTARRPEGARLALWLAAPLIVVAAAAVMTAYEPNAFTQLFPRGDSFRAAIWGAEWRRYLEGNPWFGLGTLTSDRVVVDDRAFAHPHSLYLASALQGGLVGLVILLAVLGCTVWKLVEMIHARAARLGLSLIAAGTVAYLFDGWELIDKVSVSWLVIWLPAGIAWALGSAVSESRAGDRSMTVTADIGR